MIKQTISPAQSVRAELALEVVDLTLVVARISFAWQMLEPDRVQFQSTQTEHPLQRHRKITPALEIFCREPAAEKNCHPEKKQKKRWTSNAELSLYIIQE